MGDKGSLRTRRRKGMFVIAYAQRINMSKDGCFLIFLRNPR